MKNRLGQDPKVHDFQRQKSQQAATCLKNLLQPVLLQRKKADFEEVLQLPEKLEVVVWVPLSSKQRGLYSKYLEGRELQKVLTHSSYPIEAVNYLKTLCRHPFLTEATIAKKQLGASEKRDVTIDDLADMIGTMSMRSDSCSSKQRNDENDICSPREVRYVSIHAHCVGKESYFVAL